MRKIAVFAVVLLLGGCVSQSTLLRDKDGHVMRCAGWGFGVIGAPVALAEHADCMKKARAAGFSEIPAAPTAPSVPTK